MALKILSYNILLALVIFSYIHACNSDDAGTPFYSVDIQPHNVTLQERVQEACNQVVEMNIKCCDTLLYECCRPDRTDELRKYDPICGFIPPPGKYEMIFLNRCELISFRCRYRGICILSDNKHSSCKHVQPKPWIDCSSYQFDVTTPERPMACPTIHETLSTSTKATYIEETPVVTEGVEMLTSPTTTKLPQTSTSTSASAMAETSPSLTESLQTSTPEMPKASISSSNLPKTSASSSDMLETSISVSELPETSTTKKTSASYTDMTETVTSLSELLTTSTFVTKMPETSTSDTEILETSTSSPELPESASEMPKTSIPATGIQETSEYLSTLTEISTPAMPKTSTTTTEMETSIPVSELSTTSTSTTEMRQGSTDMTGSPKLSRYPIKLPIISKTKPVTFQPVTRLPKSAGTTTVPDIPNTVTNMLKTIMTRRTPSEISAMNSTTQVSLSTSSTSTTSSLKQNRDKALTSSPIVPATSTTPTLMTSIKPGPTATPTTPLSSSPPNSQIFPRCSTVWDKSFQHVRQIPRTTVISDNYCPSYHLKNHEYINMINRTKQRCDCGRSMSIHPPKPPKCLFSL
ncbi:uncharacterized protein [Amphiura filiformis]|uniref:uncharacterized protein n=1 Tax=Amphiura filiformis TaxID=82378 RepID=UPI003B20E796